MTAGKEDRRGTRKEKRGGRERGKMKGGGESSRAEKVRKERLRIHHNRKRGKGRGSKKINRGHSTTTQRKEK